MKFLAFCRGMKRNIELHFFNPIKLKYTVKANTKKQIKESTISDIRFRKIDEYYVRKKDGSNINDDELREWTSTFCNFKKYAFVVVKDRKFCVPNDFILLQKRLVKYGIEK